MVEETFYVTLRPLLLSLFHDMDKQNTTQELLTEARHYIDLRLRHLRYFSTEKLSYLIAAATFIVIALILGIVVICNFSHSLLLLLQNYVGTIVAHVIVGAVALLMIFLIYWQRKRWILNPLTRTLARALIDNENDNNHS